MSISLLLLFSIQEPNEAKNSLHGKGGEATCQNLEIITKSNYPIRS